MENKAQKSSALFSKKTYAISFATAALFAITGCSTSSVNLTEVTDAYYNGNARKAYQLSQKGANLTKSKDEKAEGSELLYQITGGVIGFDLGSPKAAEYLTRASDNFTKLQNTGIITSMFQDLAATAVNDTILPYSGYLYEGAMISYYQGLNAMASKNYADAKVFLNTAAKRQEQIEEYYAGQITSAQQMIDKIQSTIPKGKQEEKQPELQPNPKFASFKGYINPMIDYVTGLFFMLEEKNQADVEYFFKKSLGISGAEIIKEDLAYATSNWGKINSGSDKFTWIIIEDGKSPSKGEQKISFPIFNGESISRFALALPTFQEGVAFSDSYKIKSNNGEINATRIASLNPLFYNEFKLQYPLIVTRSVLSSTLKAVAQYQIQKNSGAAGKALSGFSALTGSDSNSQSAKADLRISTIFPEGFFVARVKNTEEKFQVLDDKGNVIYSATLSKDCNDAKTPCVSKNNIIYIRNADKSKFSHILMSK